MFLRTTMLAAVGAVQFFLSIGGALAIPENYQGPQTYEGTREELRVLCHHLGGERTESRHGMTRCDVAQRGVTYVCRHDGRCQIFAYSPSPRATGSGPGGSLSDPGDGTTEDLWIDDGGAAGGGDTPDDGDIIIIL